MKKQFLLIAIFSLAILFAGTTKVAAQPKAKDYVTILSGDPVCLTPTPFTITTGACAADALHPVQGTPYTYTITTTATTDVVRWFVVNNNDLVAPDSLISSVGGVLPSTNANIDPGTGLGDYLLSVTTIANYNTAVANNVSIELSWKYFDGITNQVILVAYVDDGNGCTNNIAAYRIIPQPKFTLDIASINETDLSTAGPTATANQECVSPIESAVYSGSNTTPDGTLTVDYGENWAFFIVNGANYIDSWMPQFQIDYDLAAPGAVEASWAYLTDAKSTDPTVWNTLTGTLGGTWVSSDPVIAGATAASVTAGTSAVGNNVVPASGGECIVVRVRLDWGTDVEHDGNNGTLTVAVDGVGYDGDNSATGGNSFYDNRTFADLHYADCTDDNFTNDVVDYIITPRPEVQNATAAPVDTEDKTGDEVD